MSDYEHTDFSECKKLYQRTSVIRDLNLEIDKGEFIAIVGASGCGKSTLLRIIAGLEVISAGRIFLGDDEITDKKPKDRNIAMVFQSYALYPHMKVYDNIAYSLKLQKLPKTEIKKRVIEIADVLKIKTLLDRKPNALSGGQRQRVAIGRAIVRDPHLFLFDEPLSNLDANLRVDLRLAIKKIQKKLAVTSLYVTHDQIEAMTMADRIAVMNQGCIEQIATAEEIYNKPASLFVAQFMGVPNMNFVTAKVAENGMVLAGLITLPIRLNQQDAIGKKVILGIRPEHIQLCDSNHKPVIAMIVDAVEYLGAETLLYGSLHNNMTRLTVKINDCWQGQVGQSIHLHIEKKHVHAFDSESQRRLELSFFL